MEIIQQEHLGHILKEGLQKSTTYKEYRNLVSHLVANNASTGPEQSDAMINYTMLNERRMKRWDKTIKVSEAFQQQVSEYSRNVTWLVLTESWCGDAAHVMPVINKLAELNDNIDLRVVLRDENAELMNQFLTNGNKSIPKLISIDNKTGEVLGSYGPRPSKATELVTEFKAEHGALTPEFKEDLQHWYNKDKGQTTIEDLLRFLD